MIELQNESDEYFEETFLIPSLGETEIEEDYDFTTHDIHETIVSRVPILVEKARHAAKSGLSFSYRGFLVGAAALAYRTDPAKPETGTYTSGNYKAKLSEEDLSASDVEDIPKNCAEMDINLRASSDDFERIGIIVVAGTTKKEKIQAVTPLQGETLEPCDECESVMRHSDLVDIRTIIMTVGSGDNIYQVQDFASLSKRHQLADKGTKPSKLTRYPYSSYSWEDRRRRYAAMRDQEGISPNIRKRSKKDERRCQELALLAMLSTKD